MENFIKELETVIAGDLEDVSFEYVEVFKMNQKLHGLAFKTPDSNAAPVFYVDEAYNAYRAGIDIDRIAKDIVEAYKASLTLPKPKTNEMDFPFDKIKDKLTSKLLAKERNEEFLKTVPHKDMGNGLDLIACIDFNDAWLITVTNDMLEDIGVDSETLFDKAIEDDVINSPATLGDMVRMILGEADNLLLRDKPLDELERMYVLSNNKTRFGATCLFYPGVMDKIVELFGCNYYVVPSSVHEWIIIPDSGEIDIRQIKETIIAANRSVTDAQDVLYDTLLYFNGSELVTA